MESLESGILDLPDFYFAGDDYRYRFEPEAKQRFLDLLRGRFNSGAVYRKRVLKWDTVIEQKTHELGRFLNGKQAVFNFIEPSPKLERHDDHELRAKILDLTQSQARETGIRRSTLCYLRKNASNEGSFKTYRKVAQRILLASRQRESRTDERGASSCQ
jgi:CRISPR-associated protein Cas1